MEQEKPTPNMRKNLFWLVGFIVAIAVLFILLMVDIRQKHIESTKQIKQQSQQQYIAPESNLAYI